MSPEDLQGQVARSAAVERELREEIGKLRAELAEAKTAAARTCYQGGTAAGEVLAKMQAEHARLEEERSELRKLLRDLRQGAIEHGQHRNAKAARQEADGGRCCCVGCITVRVVDAVEARWPESDNAALRQPAVGPAQDGAGAAPRNVAAQKWGRLGTGLAWHLWQEGEVASDCDEADATAVVEWLPPGQTPCEQVCLDCKDIDEERRAEQQPARIPPIDHDFKANTWPKRDECDKRVSDNPDGRPSRQCGRPRREHREPEGGK